MSECIFCRTRDGLFTTREHILPESLGGGDWALLPSGMFCNTCQNRFGSQIEQQALSDYPFSHLRVLFGIPTKKLKAPWMQTWEGILRGDPRPGMLGYDPAPAFEHAVKSGSKTQLRVLAQPIKPAMVCRMLLKMGIEALADGESREVFESRYDCARRFSLTGEKPGSWWYIQHEDMAMLNRYLRGITVKDWEEGVNLSILEPLESAIVFRFQFLAHTFMVPLVEGILQPHMNELPEPEYRIFVV